VALGWLHKNDKGVGGAKGYVLALGGSDGTGAGNIELLATNIHLAFDRELAAVIAGRQAADDRRAVLIGAGSIGSQLAMNLAREGYFRWTIVDDDRLMPHNLARHELPADYVGSLKAGALAHELSRLLREPCPAIIGNVLFPTEAKKATLDASLAEAEIIIDASASVAVSRHLSHLPEAGARRFAAFFNPSGTACVLLAECEDRSVTLHDLEAQYHRLLQAEPSLENHLATTHAGLRYSGSCRAATNRIPATRAAVLSAVAARGVADAADTQKAVIQIWSLTGMGGVDPMRQEGAPVTRREIGEWLLVYDDGLLAKLSRVREERLPNETGGVLLGLVDRERHMLHLVDALPQPADSVSSTTGFERGVDGLLAAVNRATEKSMHQIQYVGEWHSHPRRSSAAPSVTDLTQVAWLGEQMDSEGVPVVMAIAADNGAYTFVTTNPSEG
jgi:integrative and conjugative element protein (TIGR02256 family)